MGCVDDGGVYWSNTQDRRQIGPFHIYNRAKNGRSVFRCDEDRDVFLDLLESRVSRAKFRPGRYRRAARIIEAEVSSICLMTTHFHLIVWQDAREALRRLMQSLLSAYVSHYNRKYHQKGPLFPGPFRSKPITDEKQLKWTTAYVHDNHPDGPGYCYSSHGAYLDDHRCPQWLAAHRTLEVFGGVADYIDYMERRARRAALNQAFF